MLDTIFIKIPSLDDEELIPTIKNAIYAAKHPERLHFGISLMYSEDKYRDRLLDALKTIKVDFNYKLVTTTFKKELLGVGKQRKIVNDMYDGQDWVLQIDSHTWFAPHWDTKLIDIHPKDPMTILTAYAGKYKYVNNSRVPIGDGKFRFPKVVKNLRQYVRFTDNWIDEPIYDDSRELIESEKFCANFAFGTSEWGKNPCLIADAIFFAEEPLQTVYLKKAGFKLMYPNIVGPIICHLYIENMTEGSRRPFTDYISQEEAQVLIDGQDEILYRKHMKKLSRQGES